MAYGDFFVGKNLKKKYIDDKEKRIEKNIIDTYMAAVGDFIKSRKKKITI